MKPTDIKQGHLYRARRLQEGLSGNNDRVVVWMGGDKVQYDSDTVWLGERYPTVKLDAFARWAKDHSPDCKACGSKEQPQ